MTSSHLGDIQSCIHLFIVSLELDRCELREVFQSMGMPIGERRLSELMGRFDVDNRWVCVYIGFFFSQSYVF